jgi:hypothetical protein
MNRVQSSAAIVGGIAGILLMPLVTAAYYRSWGGWDGAPIWVRPVSEMLRPLLNLGSRADTYQTYGRLFLPIFILLLIAAFGLRRIWTPILDREGKRGLNLIIVGLILNIMGSIGDYWLGYDVLQQPLWGLSFFIGTEIGSLIYVVGSVMIGRSAFRSKTIARLPGWLMILAPPIGVALTFWGIQHIPGAFVFAIAVGWLLLAITYRSLPKPSNFSESRKLKQP